ncbi:MAG: helix-turn-helix domain-containing protein [Lentisphaeria bacterium]|nr:helix-turn-helix domain-containing protein [Lentisphaeria bacterium]
MKSSLLDKSFRILERITSSPDPVTLKELASELDINRSTASRIASDLIERNLVRKAGYHSFVPATGLIRMGKAAADTPLVRTARKLISARTAELNVGCLFAGVDAGSIVPLVTASPAKGDGLPPRLPLWRSHLAAVILAFSGSSERAENFFHISINAEKELFDIPRELTLFNSRRRMASENGYIIFRDPRLGWSVNFPVQVPDEVFGLSFFGRDTENCNLERMQFECSRLASKLASELSTVFYG